MDDSFITSGAITLRPGSASVPYSFTFAAASSATANDGSIPYDSTIIGAVVKAFDRSGTDRTSEMIVGTPVVASPVVTVSLKYPATTGVGLYSLEFVLTLSTGAVMEFDFTRVLATDITA